MQVLRWFGYFRERVTDGAGEADLRVRRIVVLYYQEDDSLEVSEPKQGNSGLMQVPTPQPLLGGGPTGRLAARAGGAASKAVQTRADTSS